MEIDFPPRLLPRPQDPPRGICVEYPLLTKHVDVVDGERAGVTEFLQRWNLNIDDVLSSHFSCATPRNNDNKEAFNATALLMDGQIAIIAGVESHP